MRGHPSIEEVIKIHQSLIEEFGRSFGIRDNKLLESAVMRSHSGYYRTILEDAAALMESLMINHPFIEGNKRISFFAADIFLRLNGYFIDCDNDETYAYFIVLLNSNEFRFRNLLKWLENKVVTL